MSKRAYIARYLMIIRKVRTGYTGLDELEAYVRQETEYLRLLDDRLEMAFSQRTLQRDITEIRQLFGIDIRFDREKNGYHVTDTTGDGAMSRLLDAFEVINALQLTDRIHPFILPDTRRAAGAELLPVLARAISSHRQVIFRHMSFGYTEALSRTVDPYALKEFRGRWYLLGRDEKDGNRKSFALDRITALEITGKRFQWPPVAELKAFYDYSFGIISPKQEKPELIKLAFEPFQGAYIKTLKLHDTQEVMEDTEEHLIVTIEVYITHDLIMELLSYGDTLTVLEPPELIAELKTIYRNALNQY